MSKDPFIQPPGERASESIQSQGRIPGAEDLWTTKEVGKFLHVSAKTVFELRKKGLPFVKLGGAVRFVPNEIRSYLDNSRRLSSHRLRQIARRGSPP